MTESGTSYSCSSDCGSSYSGSSSSYKGSVNAGEPESYGLGIGGGKDVSYSGFALSTGYPNSTAKAQSPITPTGTDYRLPDNTSEHSLFILYASPILGVRKKDPFSTHTTNTCMEAWKKYFIRGGQK